jgi:hypothetical protein
METLLWILGGYGVVMTMTQICLWHHCKMLRGDKSNYEMEREARTRVLRAFILKHRKLEDLLGQKVPLDEMFREYDDFIRRPISD